MILPARGSMAMGCCLWSESFGPCGMGRGWHWVLSGDGKSRTDRTDRTDIGEGESEIAAKTERKRTDIGEERPEVAANTVACAATPSEARAKGRFASRITRGA